MSHLELNESEQAALAEVLKNSLSELREEVAHTDRPDYRNHLKEHEQSIRQILSKLDQA
jgi:hypothetical protein